MEARERQVGSCRTWGAHLYRGCPFLRWKSDILLSSLPTLPFRWLCLLSSSLPSSLFLSPLVPFLPLSLPLPSLLAPPSASLSPPSLYFQLPLLLPLLSCSSSIFLLLSLATLCSFSSSSVRDLFPPQELCPDSAYFLAVLWHAFCTPVGCC